MFFIRKYELRCILFENRNWNVFWENIDWNVEKFKLRCFCLENINWDAFQKEDMNWTFFICMLSSWISFTDACTRRVWCFYNCVTVI